MDVDAHMRELYPVTDEIDGPNGFILRNGEWLDLGIKLHASVIPAEEDRRDWPSIAQKGLTGDAMAETVRRAKAIRATVQQGRLFLSMGNEPTNSQRRTIGRYIREFGVHEIPYRIYRLDQDCVNGITGNIHDFYAALTEAMK